MKWLLVLPFGLGLFIIAPILLLASAMVLIWFVAEGRGIDQSSTLTEEKRPAAPDERNKPVKLILSLPTEGGYRLEVPQPPDAEEREPSMSNPRQAP